MAYPFCSERGNLRRSGSSADRLIIVGHDPGVLRHESIQEASDRAAPLPDHRSSHPRQKVQPLVFPAWRSIQSEARRTEMRGNGGSVPSLRELLPLQG